MGDERMKEHCEAILTAIASEVDSDSDDLVKYWDDFYRKWGYKDEQKADIERVIKELLL
jgi:arsenate reductase-like glutaredoxin family protein